MELEQYHKTRNIYKFLSHISEEKLIIFPNYKKIMDTVFNYINMDYNKLRALYRLFYVLIVQYGNTLINTIETEISTILLDFIDKNDIGGLRNYISDIDIDNYMGSLFSYPCSDSNDEEFSALMKYIDANKSKISYYTKIGSKIEIDPLKQMENVDILNNVFSYGNAYFINVAIGTVIKRLLDGTGIDSIFSSTGEEMEGGNGIVTIKYSPMYKKLKIVEKKTKKGLFIKEFFIGKKCLNPLSIFFPTYMYTYAVSTDQKTMYMEYIDKKSLYSLNNQLSNENLDNMYADIIFQIACALYIAQNTCNFSHYDLYTFNFLIKVYETPITIYYPIITDRIYTAKIRTKYTVKIIDYGLSKMSLNIDDNFIDVGTGDYIEYNIYKNAILPGMDLVKILLSLMENNKSQIFVKLYDLLLKGDPITNEYYNVSPYVDSAYIIPSEIIKSPIFKKYKSIELIERKNIDVLLRDWQTPFYGPSEVLTGGVSQIRGDIEYYINQAHEATKRKKQFPYMILFYLQIIKNIRALIDIKPHLNEFSDRVNSIYAKLMDKIMRILTYPKTHKMTDILGELTDKSNHLIDDIKRDGITSINIEKYRKLKTQLIGLLARTISLPEDKRKPFYKQVNKILARNFPAIMKCQKISPE